MRFIGPSCKMIPLVLAVMLSSGCAHRSGYGVRASPGYQVTFPAITWDYPSQRASVVYVSQAEALEDSRKWIAERHLDQTPTASPGGYLSVTLYDIDLRRLGEYQAIALVDGKVIARETFALKNTKIVTGGSSAYWQAWAAVEMPSAPVPGKPVALEIVGPRLDDGPYRFTVSAIP